PYQPYIDNIVSQIVRRFHTNMRLTAEVQFMIHRDGSVDVDGIKVTKPSPAYVFNQQAAGAVEAAAEAHAFGPLPPGFHDDILPVTFRFTPSLVR
ncbi:MAG TPA: TonB C-terminal domain-containing protein, partial [Gemmatimonadaceae bacterium]|nr:TonB C-terminal domain-containing protein [Gemmatimonadaceae bacterium]